MLLFFCSIKYASVLVRIQHFEFLVLDLVVASGCGERAVAPIDVDLLLVA